MNPADPDHEPARFSTAASTYDNHSGLQARVARHLLDLLPTGLELDSILEVGCGTGLFTRLLTKQFPAANLYVCDVSKQMLRRARRKLNDNSIHWLVADARQLRITRKFPLLTSSASFHWMRPLSTLFANLRQQLQPDGRLTFSLMLRDTLRELHRVRKQVAPEKSPGDRLPSVTRVVDSLRENGFQLISRHREEFRQKYSSGRGFLKALNEQGVTGGEMIAPSEPLTPAELEELVDLYETEYSVEGRQVVATYDVLFLDATPA